MPTQEKKRVTEHATFRIDKEILDNLKLLAKDQNLSLNTVVNQVLDSHINWDQHAPQVGWVVMLKAAMIDLIKNVDSEAIIKTATKASENGAKEISLFMRGKYGIEEWISILKDRAKKSGFNFKEYHENGKTKLVMHHDMGEKWSLFFKSYFENVFVELGSNVKADFTENTMIIEIDGQIGE